MKVMQIATVWWLAGILAAPVQAADGVPAGYRHFTHVKSMVILPGHPLAAPFGGMHHVYVNDTGLAALKAGSKYPDGSVLVFDLFESTEQDHAYVEGARKVTAVMEKHAKKFAATGGWDFRAYKEGQGANIVKDAASECYSCHTAQEKRDFVFSTYTP
jgi:hypothetical protein